MTAPVLAVTTMRFAGRNHVGNAPNAHNESGVVDAEARAVGADDVFLFYGIFFRGHQNRMNGL